MYTTCLFYHIFASLKFFISFKEVYINSKNRTKKIIKKKQIIMKIKQHSQKTSPNSASTYLPSFNGISSNTSFQQTGNSIKISERQNLSISQSITNLEELIMINDGVEYIFNFTDSAIDGDDIFDIFQELTKQNEFQMIEREQTYCTAIKQVKNTSFLSKLNISELLFGCFTFLHQGNQKAHITGQSLTSNSPSAIKIVVSKIMHEEKQMKICRIKGLSGLIRQVKAFIDKFKQKITQYLPQNSQHMANCFFYDPDKQTENENKGSIQYSDPYHLEISTYYVIQKILSNDVYEIGGLTLSLIDDYMKTFQNIQESLGLIPQPINNAVKIVNEIYHWFLTHNNIKQQSKSTNKKKKQSPSQQALMNNEDNDQKIVRKIPLHESMTPFLRVSIEKYIFQRLAFPIFDIYKLKNKQSQQIFIGKRAKIFEKYSTRQILEEISLNEKFWSVDAENYDDIDHMHTIKETKFLLRMSSQCCAQLQKIPLTPNPRQKIKHIELAYTGLKTFYYDYSKQKYQLSSMQDIIPVLILIVLLLNVQGLRKQLDIVGDFIQSDPYQMQSEKRLYINLSQSYNYIVRDWKI